ncbi:MAG TPA: hypothetical protein VEI57_01140 [Nitrospirota bacterium]|nr:hypothetical protein [Nitrospirota bacterium]
MVFATAAGLFAGYVLGTLTGLRMQYLGWIDLIINMATGFGTIIILGTYVVMVFVLRRDRK